MELLGHNFFVFLNAETEEVNVVYKWKGNTNDVKNVIEKNVGSLSQYVPKLHFDKMNECFHSSILSSEKVIKSNKEVTSNEP